MTKKYSEYYKEMRNRDWEIERYKKLKENYENASVLNKIKMNLRGEKPVETSFDVPDMDTIGARYGFRYHDLDIPVLRNEDLEKFISAGPGELAPYNPTRRLNSMEIDNLWTIVEYIGNGLYKDTATGKVFSYGVRESEVEDRLDDLMENPLGIGLEYQPGRDNHRPCLSRITPEIEKEVQKTIQEVENVKAVLSSLEEQSRKLMEERYASKGKTIKR